MTTPRLCVLAFVLLSSALSVSQQWATSSSTQDPHLPAAPSAPALQQPTASPDNETLPFTVENPKHLRFSPRRARRIYEETLRELKWQFAGTHVPTITLTLTLRLGQGRDYIDTETPARKTLISMKKWDEVTFARMIVRAFRNALFSDSELDTVALNALRRVQSQVSVDELRRH